MVSLSKQLCLVLLIALVLPSFAVDPQPRALGGLLSLPTSLAKEIICLESTAAEVVKSLVGLLGNGFQGLTALIAAAVNASLTGVITVLTNILGLVQAIAAKVGI